MDQDTPVSNPEVEGKAKHLGWVPQEAFHGDPDKWVPAEEFVRRGEEIMPILKKNNERLHSEVAGLGGQVQTLQKALKESQDSIAALVTHQTESTTRAVESAKKTLTGQLRQAIKDGDFDTQFALTDEIQDLDKALAEAPKLKVPTATPAPVIQPVVDPEFTAWAQDNPFFNVDMKKTALMQGAAQELRNDRKNDHLKGRAFYDAALKAVDAYLAPASRVDGKSEGGGGATSQGGGARVRTFADLPADARQVCERQAEKLVGPNRAFKTKKEWQAHYVTQFFIGE